MADLQELCGRWHTQRFPDASPIEVGLKLLEEAGEVASELLTEMSKMSAKTPEKTFTPEECADVVITLMVLLERWFPGRVLLEEVQIKMNKLTDPSSGHRAAMAIV